MSHWPPITMLRLGGKRADKMVECVKAAMGVRTAPPPVEFSVSCLPIPQPRQRHRVIRSGPKAYATNYTPAKHPVNGFKTAIMFESRKRCDVPLAGPVEIRLRFRFPLPAAAKAADRRAVAAGSMLPYVAKLRNDGDNLEKAVWDALTGILYADDSQICRWSGERVYAKEPGVDVWIAEWRP